MKKIFTGIIVFIISFSLYGTAFAGGFIDTMEKKADQQAAIGKLDALKIINGYPDGTFKPDNTITRAEFAKIATVLGGMASNADALKSSPSKFSDVKAGEWYSGFVDLAASQGWVKGFPDGTFRPNNKISYAEVITVLLRILGYNDNLPGTWPVDYIAEAGSLDITQDVSFDFNNPATRVDVAVMGNEILDATVVKWNADKQTFEDKTKEEDNKTVDVSLMDDRFESAVVEGVLFGPDLKYDDEKNQFTIDVFNGADVDGDGDTDSSAKVAADYTLLGGGYAYSIPYCEMHMADVIYDGDKEEITYIEVTSKVMASEDIEIKTQKNGKVTRISVDGNKSYDVITDVFVMDDDVPDALKAYYQGVDNDENGKFDGELYKVYLNEDDEAYVVGDISGPDLSAIGTNNEFIVLDEKGWDPQERILYTVSAEEEYKLYDDYDDVYVLINTAPGSLEALKPGYVLTVGEKDNGNFGSIDAYSPDAFLSGEYEGVAQDDELPLDDDYDEIIISGKDYDISPWCLISQDNGETWDDVKNSIFDDMSTSDIKFFLNYSGDVAMIIANIEDESNKIYGVVTDIADINHVKSKIAEIKVLKKDGKEASYSIDTSEVELYYVKDKNGVSLVPDRPELDVDDFIKFSVNEDNEIDDLDILAYYDKDKKMGAVEEIVNPFTKGSANVKADYTDSENTPYIGVLDDADDDNNRIEFNGKWYKLNDSTIVFNGFAHDDDEASVETIADLIDWAASSEPGGGRGATAYVQYDGNTVEYIYVFGDVSESASADYAAVLTTYKKSGDAWADVDIKGTKEAYKVNTAGDTLEEGSIYDYSITSNKFKGKTEVFDPDDTFVYRDETYTSVLEGTYAKVTSVDKTDNAVEINRTWIYLDEDTVIYDYSDWYESNDDPEYCSGVKSVTKNDYIIYFGTENEVDLLIIVNNIRR